MKSIENSPPDSLTRLVSQIRGWEKAALDCSQDQTSKTEEQAYHLGKKDAYEAARLAIEREKINLLESFIGRPNQNQPLCYAREPKAPPAQG